MCVFKSPGPFCTCLLRVGGVTVLAPRGSSVRCHVWGVLLTAERSVCAFVVLAVLSVSSLIQNSMFYFETVLKR